MENSITSSDLARSITIIDRIIRAMCICPEQLTVDFSCDGTALYVDVEANTADAKRLVGKGGSHLSALKSLASAIVAGTGSKVLVEFNRIRSTDLPEIPFTRMEPQEDWDSSEVSMLFEGIVEACYPDAAVKFMSEERDDRSWTMKAWVETEPCSPPRRIYEVSRALHYLFIPIGMVSGRPVYANVNTEHRGDAQAHHAMGGTARPIHVHGPKPNQREAVVSGQHRRELGSRDVRLSGLGGSQKPGAAADR